MKTPYVPHGWQALEMVTKDNLNHMEEGIGGNDAAIRALEAWKSSNGDQTPAPAVLKSLSFALDQSFSDAAENTGLQITAKMDPVQKQNGQSAVWPGGGGKNLYNAEAYPLQPGFINYKTGAAQSLTSETYMCTRAFIPCEQLRGQTITISPEPNGTNPGAAFYSADNEAAYISGGKGTAILVPDNASYLRFTVDTESENAAMIEIGETATSWEPYESIWPISGYTGVEISAAGENLCPVLNVIPSDQAVTVTVNADGSVTINGTQGETDGIVALSTPFTVKKNGKYFLSGCPSGGSAESYQLSFCLPNQAADENLASKKDTGSGVAFFPTITHQTCVCIRLAAGTTVENLTFHPMVSMYIAGETRPYEPYHGTIHNILFPASAGTVYGGELLLRSDGSAILSVDRALTDLGELTYTYNQAGYFSARIPTAAVTPADAQAVPDLLCSVLPIATRSQITNGQVDYGISISLNTNSFQVRYGSITDPAELKTALDGYVAVTRLSSSQVYEFTAEQILSLAGSNNLYADTGDIAVDYVLDTGLILDNLNSQSDIFAHGVNYNGLDVSYKDGVLRLNGVLSMMTRYKITSSGVVVEPLAFAPMTGLLSLKAGHKYILHAELPGETPGSSIQLMLYTYNDLSGGGQYEYAKITGTTTIAEGATLDADKYAKLLIYVPKIYLPNKTDEEANTYDHVEIPLSIIDIDCTQ